ncbi:MAG: hypothetical protein Kow0037_01220 [Calditrichia bacterium]
MSNLSAITRKTQTKLYQFLIGYKKHHTLPEYKFLSDCVLGIIKSKHIHLAKIGRQLQETISPKKTEERLSYHLAKPGLSEQILEKHLLRIRPRIKRCRYLIYDGSDIIKNYAGKMDGLARVRDGSASGSKTVLGQGYHWDNLVGVSEDGSALLPLYSEIYSIKADKDCRVSENRKIIKMQQVVSLSASKDSIWVMDRGGDRRVLIKTFLERKQQFVIRQRGEQHLFYQDKCLPLKELSRKVKLQYRYRVTRNNHGRLIKHDYAVGGIQVNFPTNDLRYKRPERLWLVVSREKQRGYSWFLCYLNTDEESEAVRLAMQGYQYRWKIEEFHRQVKQDYALEEIRYQRYEAIRTIGSLLVVVMGFLATLGSNFVHMVLRMGRLWPGNRLTDCPRYKYYRLSEAMKIILAKTTRMKRKTLLLQGQMELRF